MKTYPPVIFAFLMLPFMLSCHKKENADNAQPPADNLSAAAADALTVTADQFDLARMELGSLNLFDDSERVTASGYVDVPPENKVRIGTFMGGYIQSVDLIPGDHVKKGQILVVLENIEYLKLQQSYLDAKEQLDYLKSLYESQKALSEEKITAQKVFLEARSNYNRMLATYESLDKQLRLININPSDVKAETMVSSISLKSPIDGFITEVKAVRGMFVNPSDLICEIVNTDHLHLQIKIFEKDMLAVRTGQSIDFRIPESSHETCRGEIIMVGKTVEEKERTIIVHGHIKDSHGLKLAPGMYIEATIHTGTRKVKGLPREALVTEEGKYYVFLRKPGSVDPYIFEKVPVQVGKITESWFEVLDSSATVLGSDASILVKGAYYLEKDI